MKIRRVAIVLASLMFTVILGVAIAAVYLFYPGPDGTRDCAEESQIDLQQFFDQIPDFIEKYYDPAFEYNPLDVRGHFSIDAGGVEDLYGAVDMAYIFWITGELESRTTEEGRAAWAGIIQGYQNPRTGLFDRGNYSGESVLHATAFATAGLKLLGHEPLYPHLWAEDIFSTPEQIEAWLDSFRWEQIWSGSHDTGAAAAVIDAPKGLNLPANWGDMVLAAFTDRTDSRTGFWKNAGRDGILTFPTTIDLGGAAHFWWIYYHLGEEIPHAPQAMESILRTQRRTGIWGGRVFNGAFPQGIDFDAINGYRFLLGSVSPDFREGITEQIIASVDQYACALDFHLNRPGSLEDLYNSSHKLVGLLNTLAEVNLLYSELTGEAKLTGVGELRSALDFVAWQ
jgi:hypothetical protein